MDMNFEGDWRIILGDEQVDIDKIVTLADGAARQVVDGRAIEGWYRVNGDTVLIAFAWSDPKGSYAERIIASGLEPFAGTPGILTAQFNTEYEFPDDETFIDSEPAQLVKVRPV